MKVRFRSYQIHQYLDVPHEAAVQVELAALAAEVGRGGGGRGRSRRGHQRRRRRASDAGPGILDQSNARDGCGVLQDHVVVVAFVGLGRVRRHDGLT